MKGVSEGETLGSFQTWLTAATEWEHQGLVLSPFFNRVEIVSEVKGWGRGIEKESEGVGGVERDGEGERREG